MNKILMSAMLAMSASSVAAQAVDPLLLTYFIEENAGVYSEITIDKAGEPILPATFIEIPEIKVLPQAEINALSAKGKKLNLEGLYIYGHNTIYLSESVDLDTVYGTSVLLHELVHHVQMNVGLDKVAPCHTALETQAHEMQAKYLVANGYAADSKEVADLEFAAVVMGMCKPGHLIDRPNEN